MDIIAPSLPCAWSPKGRNANKVGERGRVEETNKFINDFLPPPQLRMLKVRTDTLALPVQCSDSDDFRVPRSVFMATANPCRRSGRIPESAERTGYRLAVLRRMLAHE